MMQELAEANRWNLTNLHNTQRQPTAQNQLPILMLYSLCGDRDPKYKVYVNEERPQPLDSALVRGEGSCGFSFQALFAINEALLLA